MNQIETILNSPCGKLNQHLEHNPVKKSKVIKARNDCAEVQWMHWQLKYWCIEQGIHFEKEYRFKKPRRFKFDFCLPYQKIGIEYEGIFSENSRHTNKIGYSTDTDKYRLAAMDGFTVLRYTALNYKNVLQDIEKLIYKK